MKSALAAVLILANTLSSAPAAAEETTGLRTLARPRPLEVFLTGTVIDQEHPAGEAGLFLVAPRVSVALEAALSLAPDDYSFGAYFRAGYSLALVDSRSRSGRGWSLDLPLLVGYRYVNSRFLDPAVFRGADGTVSLRATRWFARHFGLSARLRAGVGAGQVERPRTCDGGLPTTPGPTTRSHFQSIGFADLGFGLAF